MLQNYLACGEDSSEAVEFYGLNAYEWSVVAAILHEHTSITANTRQVRPSNIRHIRLRLSPDECIGIQHSNLLLRDWLHC